MTMAELVFAKHTDDFIQLIPFGCCIFGLAMIALVWRRHDAGRIRTLRYAMEAIAAASVFGMAEHLWNAYEITRDFHPGIAGWELVRTTLTSSIPLLAPGALAAGAFVSLIAMHGLPSPAPVTAGNPNRLRRA
jgi:hypothetical protein